MSPARRARRGPGRRPIGRRGMTLIEVIMAVVILVGPLLAVASLSGKLARAVGENGARNRAGQLAVSRLEEVKGAAGRYAELTALYAGTEYAIPGAPGFRRLTMVKRVTGTTQAPIDYSIVTVEVSAVGLREPIRKTTVISNF